MSISSKGWTAQIDRMPGAASFRTYGTVTVADCGITPTLVLSARQDKTTNIRLDLLLEESSDMSLQVLTDKFVEYKEMGNSNVTGVSIFHDGKLLHHISEVMITH